MKAYKGFKSDMTCRGFQYEEGKTYTTAEARLCYSGFHACLMPIDVLHYYGYNSKFHVVELDGEIDIDHMGDSKVAATEITIGDSLSFNDLMLKQISFVKDIAKDLSNVKDIEKDLSNIPYTLVYNGSADGYACNNHQSVGKRNIAASKGDYSIAASCGGNISIRASANSWGRESIAASTVQDSSCLAMGSRSIASATGDSNTVVANGDDSVSVGTGEEYSRVLSSGDRAISVCTGTRSIAVSSGEDSISVINGFYNKANVFGHGSIAVSNGKSNMVYVGENCTGVIKSFIKGGYSYFGYGAGELGACLIFIYEDSKGRPQTKTIHITGKKYKPHVWYYISEVHGKAVVKTFDYVRDVSAV